MIILRCLRSISCFCVVWQAALGANVVTAIQFLLQRAGENASSVLRLDTAGAAVQVRCGYAQRLPTAALSHPLDVAATRAAARLPSGRTWLWAGVAPSVAYLMLGFL
jgi:hypothetical protein